MIKMLKQLIKRVIYKNQDVRELGIKYKIGNIKHHNSHVDTLIPQLVEIGDNFISAPGSIILAHDASLFLHTGKYRCEKTIIGSNVFLGANTTILPGITIGDGAIVGAGAVVTKDVAPYTVVAGNPARFICSVKDYVSKCEKKGVLFSPPASFNSFLKGERITGLQVLEFQEKYMKEKSL